MPAQKFHKYLRTVQKDLGHTATYLRLALSGNRIERRTDFRKCTHPVLLLYGYGATRGVFSILEKRLRRDGYCVFSLRLGGMFDTYNTHGIESIAQRVHEKVERLCKRYTLKKLSVIGHSKGGLIGRYYVKRLGGRRRVRALITLGTPHHGNPWTLLGLFSPLALISKSIWQMYPMSPFIRRLKKGPFPKHVRMASIYSKEDRVCFYKSAMLDVPPKSKNLKNIELPGITHAGLVTRQSVYHVIRRELREAERHPL